DRRACPPESGHAAPGAGEPSALRASPEGLGRRFGDAHRRHRRLDDGSALDDDGFRRGAGGGGSGGHAGPPASVPVGGPLRDAALESAVTEPGAGAESAGILYVVSTPIGNMGDFSFRAVETLRSVEVVLAEDTRHTRHLLDRYEIATAMLAYHE